MATQKTSSKQSKPGKKGAQQHAVVMPHVQPAGAPAAGDDDFDGEGAPGGAPAGPTSQDLTTAAPMTMKNYRTNPDMESFFRFIFENDLRQEAFEIIDTMFEERRMKRAAKSGKAN